MVDGCLGCDCGGDVFPSPSPISDALLPPLFVAMSLLSLLRSMLKMVGGLSEMQLLPLLSAIALPVPGIIIAIAPENIILETSLTAGLEERGAAKLRPNY